MNKPDERPVVLIYGFEARLMLHSTSTQYVVDYISHPPTFGTVHEMSNYKDFIGTVLACQRILNALRAGQRVSVKQQMYLALATAG